MLESRQKENRAFWGLEWTDLATLKLSYTQKKLAQVFDTNKADFFFQSWGRTSVSEGQPPAPGGRWCWTEFFLGQGPTAVTASLGALQRCTESNATEKAVR